MLLIISGSHRNDSLSTQVASRLEGICRKLLQCEVGILDLNREKFENWQNDYWDKDSAAAARWSQLSEDVKKANGIIIISPEWGGMAPPGLKNFLLLCDNDSLGHKPALIVAVSAGLGGTYPISELRSSGYKNNRIVWIPEHIIVRNAKTLLEGSDTHNVLPRIDKAILALGLYMDALKSVRPSLLQCLSNYPYGM